MRYYGPSCEYDRYELLPSFSYFILAYQCAVLLTTIAMVVLCGITFYVSLRKKKLSVTNMALLLPFLGTLYCVSLAMHYLDPLVYGFMGVTYLTFVKSGSTMIYVLVMFCGSMLWYDAVRKLVHRDTTSERKIKTFVLVTCLVFIGFGVLIGVLYIFFGVVVMAMAHIAYLIAFIVLLVLYAWIIVMIDRKTAEIGVNITLLLKILVANFVVNAITYSLAVYAYSIMGSSIGMAVFRIISDTARIFSQDINIVLLLMQIIKPNRYTISHDGEAVP